MAKFSSKIFYFNRESKVFTQEISTLDGGHNHEVFHRVYPDACDVGITIISASTGNEVTYAVDHEDYNNDNEIAGWNLVPTPKSLRRVPACKGTRVLIIND